MSEPEPGSSLDAQLLHVSHFLSAADFLADGPAEGIPALVGKYEVEAELARGGMGVVYRALDPDTGRQVAIKRILGSFTPANLERFLNEGRAVAGLDHPGLITLYEVGRDDEGPYLVMELVAGESLGERLERETRLEPADAAGLCRDLAQALAYAHERGLLHRDVKPDNVLLRVDGSPVLCDFGLAKWTRDAAPGPTLPGEALGSPSYVSPEQAQGLSLDARSDVYSLGVTLYQLLSGALPIEADTVLSTLQRIPTEEPVPLLRLRPELSPDLVTICHRCLEKDPARRYPSAQALADDLQRQLTGEPIQSRPPSWGRRARRLIWRRRTPLTAAVCAALGVVALLSARSASESSRWSEAQQLIQQAEQQADEHQGLARITPTLERALSLHESPLLRLRAAKVWIVLREFERAQEVLEASVAANPPAYQELSLLHEIALAESPPPEGSYPLTAPLRRLLAAAEARGEETGQTCWVRGKLLVEEDPEQAALLFSRAIEAGFWVAYLDRAMAYKRLGRVDQAQLDFEEAQRRDPTHPGPSFNLAVLEHDLGRLGLAKEYLDRCLALDARFAPAYARRGTVREAQGDPGGAAEDFAAALALDPEGRRYPRAVDEARRGQRRLEESSQ